MRYALIKLTFKLFNNIRMILNDKLLVKKVNLFSRYLCYVSVCFIVLYFLYSHNYIQYSNHFEVAKVNLEYEKYKKTCLELFKELRFPNKSNIHKPPLRSIPQHMFDDFTQHGEMPLNKLLYINEAYVDSNETFSKKIDKITRDDIEFWQNAVRKRLSLNYGDKSLSDLMFKFESMLRNKSIAVIGTQTPWVEAIALEAKATNVTTLDYTRKIYEQKDVLTWLHVNDLLDNLLSGNKIEIFDNAASFSSIEHSGLGRYGDPLDPDGDIKALQQVHCMLLPDGLFFLGLPTTVDNSSYIDFNIHRMYGHKRLKKLFDGWEKLEEKYDLTSRHTVFVLKKKYSF